MNMSSTLKAGLVLAFVAALSACSSPADKATRFHEKGTAFLKQGDLVKARIEFQNAVQIKDDMAAAWFGLAQVAERQGEWDRMLAMLRKVVDRDPKHVEAQIKLGRLLLAAGQLDKALAASHGLMALDKENPSVLALHAAVLYKLDNVPEALELANAALAKDANNIDALVVLATERLGARDAAKAIEYLDRGLKLNEKNVALQLIKVQAYESVARLDSAEEVYRKLIALYPETRVLRQILAQFFLSHGRKDAAEAEFRAIMDQNPTDTAAKVEFARFVSSVRGPKGAMQELEAMIAKDPANAELKFARADLHQFMGDRKAASAVYRDLMAKAGDGADGLKAKGLLAANLLAEGDKAATKALVGEVLAKDQRNEQGLLLKASMEIDDRQLDQAIADLRTILRDAPSSPRALLLLARSHELAGAPELAQEHYLRAAQAGKMAPAFGMPYGEFLLKRGQNPRAGSVAEDILRVIPGYVPAMKLLAQARINSGDWIGAQAVADELRKRKDTAPLAEEIRGAVHAAQKNYPESIAAFKRAFASDTSDPNPMLIVVRGYIAAGKDNEALAFLDSVLKASPGNVEARLLQGQLQGAKGNQAEATRAFQGVIELQPKDVRGYLGLANLHMRFGRYPDADKVVDQGLAAIPKDFSLRLTRAGVHELAGRSEEAIRLNEELLKERPNSDVVANNLASLLTDHRTDKAALTRAHDIAKRFRRSDVPQFKDTLGWATYKLGKPEEAVAMLEAAAKQMPGHPAFRYHLGMTYLAVNKKDSARKELQEAVTLGQGGTMPESLQAKEALKGL